MAIPVSTIIAAGIQIAKEVAGAAVRIRQNKPERMRRRMERKEKVRFLKEEKRKAKEARKRAKRERRR